MVKPVKYEIFADHRLAEMQENSKRGNALSVCVIPKDGKVRYACESCFTYVKAPLQRH